MYIRNKDFLISSWLNDLSNILYPRLCIACGRLLQRTEKSICIYCRYDLPETGFHQHIENPVHEKFYGRLPLENASSLYYFHKSSRVQHLIHALKYNGEKQIGIELGKLYGHYLKNAPGFSSVQLIIPVPLHKRKLHHRGYNQSELFSKGLSEIMHIPSAPELLKRKVFTDTQTHKSRMERWENVKSVFIAMHHNRYAGKHILLVDDVLTTGATLEACGNALLEKCKDIRLSIATIACAG